MKKQSHYALFIYFGLKFFKKSFMINTEIFL